tara:strand:+ start:1670 stop:2137 length:468 start_codon:yes stop_codon:yes gene_type:complete
MKRSEYKNLIFFIFLVSFFCLDALSNENSLICKILEEKENNEPAKKKVYLNKHLRLYLSIEEKWINDVSKKKWILQLGDDALKVNTNFKNMEEYIFFSYTSFLTTEKKLIESSFSLNLSKRNGYLKFMKYYYNHNQEIFFTSEVVGNCNINAAKF